MHVLGVSLYISYNNSPRVITSSGGATFAPNRPGGLTLAFDRNYDKTDSSIPGGVLPPSPLSGTDSFHCQWSVGSPNQAPIIDTIANLTSLTGRTVPVLPDGHPTAMAVFYPSGFTAAACPFQMQYVGTALASSVRSMYGCMYVCVPGNFRSNGNNIKFWNIQNTGAGSNHIFMLNSFDNTSDGRTVWLATQGTGGTQTWGGDSSSPSGIGMQTFLTPPPPQGSGPGWIPSFYDQWTMMEYLAITETNPGVSFDGQFWGWVNGVLVNRTSNIRYNAPSGDSNGFNDITLIPYYGGGGSNAPGNEYWFLGRTQFACG